MIIAREFLRVSHDASGRERSPDEQHKVHERDAKRNNWKLHPKPYREIGSASEFRSKDRTDFPKLISDLNSNTFGAQLLILWEGSRGSRDVGEWLTLVNACKTAGVKIYIHTKDKVFDPSRPLDANDLLADAVSSARRAAEISEAVMRAMNENFELGKPHGPAPYGYRRVYENRRLVGQVPDPEEAPVVQDLFCRLNSGQSLKQIARDFESQGILTRNGIPFVDRVLSRMARNPAYIGMRVRYGDVSDGDWNGLISVDVFHNVQDILSNPKRTHTRPGRGKHLLSMIARCGICSGPLAVQYSPDRYHCRDRSCVRVKKEPLDTFGEMTIIKYLSEEKHYNVLMSPKGDSPELLRARDQLASVHIKRDLLRQRIKSEQVELEFGLDLERDYTAKINELKGIIEAESLPVALPNLGPREDIQDRWINLWPMSIKRSIARVVFGPTELGTLYLDHTTAPGLKRQPPIETRIRLGTLTPFKPGAETE